MSNKNLVAPWVRRFLLEHIVADLNLSRNTQASYRDAMTLLLPFAAKQQGQALPYLEKPEMNALLAAPDRRTSQGARDHALLLFLYNAGARADEAARLTVADLDLGTSPAAKLLGKGNKTRLCPLWPSTAGVLNTLVATRGGHEPVFLNRRREAITRFGIYDLVKRYAARAAQRPVDRRQARQPARDPAYDSRPPAARGCRHQHDPRLARSRVLGHHQHLRRSRSRDEGQGAGGVLDSRRLAQALAKGARTHGLPALTVRVPSASAERANAGAIMLRPWTARPRRWPSSGSAT